MTIVYSRLSPMTKKLAMHFVGRAYNNIETIKQNPRIQRFVFEYLKIVNTPIKINNLLGIQLERYYTRDLVKML